MIIKGFLHYTILKHIIDKGFAPNPETLSSILNVDVADVEKGLYDLQDYHGVVLHPKKPEIWVIHPFSLAPTNFFIQSSKGIWWGNCAWCSLGVAALLKEDLTITTNLGAQDQQILNPAWEKWTMQEAKEIFSEFNLADRIWDLETSGTRF